MKRSTKARILLLSGLIFLVFAPLFYMFVCVPGDICVSSCADIGKMCNANLQNRKIQPFDFESEAVDNGYHNAQVGGLLAYKDNTLYAVNCLKNIGSVGLYAINKDSAEKINDGYSGHAKEKSSPFCMYQYSGKIYVLKSAGGYDIEQEVALLDTEQKKLTDSELDINPVENKVYISDELLVWEDYDKDSGDLSVKFKGKDINVDKKAAAFDISGGKIYYINDYGNLYCLNPETSENVMISQKDRSKIKHSYPEQIICLDNYCYLFSKDLNLCGFSFDSGEFDFDLILDEEIYSLNTYGGKVYAAAESGIYELNKAECTKISDVKTKQIYIFDEQYIFTHNADGNVLRIDPGTGKTDKII